MFIEDEKEEEEGNKHKQVHDSSGKRTKIDSAISLFFWGLIFLDFLTTSPSSVNNVRCIVNKHERKKITKDF